MQLIDADDEGTWPGVLLRNLEANRDAVASFQLERQRLDRLACDDLTIRDCRPENPYQQEWDKMLALAKQATASSHLVGFHATRLMDHEVEEIKRRGLQIGSEELLQRRLVGAQNAGKLTNEDVTRLFACHQAADSNRVGRTAFFFTRAQLKDAGLDRLCRYWGGEALYNSHETGPETGALLRSLGTARIVVAAVRVADIEERFDIPYRLVNVWCRRRGIITDLPPEFGGVVRANTPGTAILRIIGVSDPEFAALTRHDSWREPLVS